MEVREPISAEETHPCAQVLRGGGLAALMSWRGDWLLRLLLLLLLPIGRHLRLAAGLGPDDARRGEATGHAVDA